MIDHTNISIQGNIGHNYRLNHGEFMAFIILLFFSTLIAFYAKSQGRSFLLWFLISAIFTPFIGFIALLVCSRLTPLTLRQNDEHVIKTVHSPKS